MNLSLVIFSTALHEFELENLSIVVSNKSVVNIFPLSSLKSSFLNQIQMLSIPIRLLVRYFTSPTLRTNSDKNNFGLLQNNMTITTTRQCGTDMGHSYKSVLWVFFKVCCFSLSYNKIDTLDDIHGWGLWWPMRPIQGSQDQNRHPFGSWSPGWSRNGSSLSS